MQLIKQQDKAQTIPEENLSFEVTHITPGIAEAWLEKNSGNRKPSESVVASYARDMIYGRWRMSGDAIRFSKTGRLIDGQHRLKACIAADKSFQSLVIYGLADDVQNVVDTNKPRSARDVLTLNGHRNAIHLAAALRVLIDIERGSTTPIRGDRGSKLSHSEVMDGITRHSKLSLSVAAADGAVGAHRPTLAAIHYIGTHFLDQVEDAGSFVAVFKTGIPRYTGDAAHATRERLMRAKSDTTTIVPSIQSMMMINAWNNFTSRRQVQVIKMPSSATIIGLDRNKLRKGTR